jgi:hypothetical protein
MRDLETIPLRYVATTYGRPPLPPRTPEVDRAISAIGIGAGQKLLARDLRLQFMFLDKRIQFSAVRIHIEDAAAIRECSQRILVSYVHAGFQPPDVGNIEQFAALEPSHLKILDPNPLNTFLTCPQHFWNLDDTGEISQTCNPVFAAFLP